MKKMIIACALLLAPMAKADAASWYWVSICGTFSTLYCPFGPDPWTFGPYDTQDECIASSIAAIPTYWGQWPRSISTCYQQ